MSALKTEIRAWIASERENYLYHLPEAKAKRDADEYALKANPAFWLTLFAETYSRIRQTIADLNSVVKGDYGPHCGVCFELVDCGIEKAEGVITISTPGGDQTLTLQVCPFTADLRDEKSRWQTCANAEKYRDGVSEALVHRVAELFAPHPSKPRAV